MDPSYYNSHEVKKALSNKRYEIIAEVGSGVNLPDDSKYKVRIQIGANSKDVDYCMTTNNPYEVYHRFNRWSTRFDSVTINTPYQSVEEMDRLYVYLLDQEDVPVCYWKGKVKDFTERNCRHNWRSLVNDEYHNKVKSTIEAGII